MVNIKKYILIMGIMILSLFSVNAITYLNSCGQSSGWINGETYLVNITTIDNTYANTYCFSFSSTFDNMTFQQVTPKITITKNNNNFAFFYSNMNAGRYTDYSDGNKFYNFNIENTNTNPTYQFIFKYISLANFFANGQNIWRYSTFENITVKNAFTFVGAWGTNVNDRPSELANSNFTNIYYYNSSYFVNGNTNFDLSYSSLGNFNSNNITNSYIDVSSKFGFYGQANGDDELYTYYNIVSNSVINGNPNIVYADVISSAIGYNDFTNSLIKGYLFVDSDDNNIADSNNLSSNGYGFKSMAIYVDKTLNGTQYRFMQDYLEGKPFFDNVKIHLPINNGNLGSPTTITIKNKLDASLITSNMIEASAFRTTLTGSELNCGLFTSYKCNIINNPNTTSATGSYYLNYIDVGSISKIRNINTSISHSGLGSVSASIIGNYDDFTLSDIEIDNNIIYSTGNILSSTNETTSRPFMKFKGNDFYIHDNNFTYSFPTNVGIGEFLNIRTTNANNNLVTLNRFTNNVSTPLQKTEISYYNLQTQFYNNYIGNNVILSSKTTTGIIPTKYVGFNHTDNYIYYYTIGNYYQENSGCTDANGDGFCDTSYTSGNVTDTKPLSSYPFVYTSHLLTYEDRVLNSPFNITLSSPTNNQTFTMSNSSGIINFGFSQNSNFQDLVCSFIIDGNNVFNTNYLVDKNIIYSINVTSWINGSHTYRVECGNNYQYIISNEIIFNVNIVTTSPTPPTPPSPYTNNSINLINGNSITETANNVNNFFGDFTNGFMNLIVPVGMFIIFFLVIIIVFKFIGG